ncbi:MarR family winged helix-turn-helix transcriptional regulator [Kribbella sp. NPDC051718]|uniref:MarR family winged helix-turn-helix transcriptional regulator n=1 Tax=Kribbella sp. NPDC051718 TaxID=3155168 RepID=UPI0034409463
MADVNGPQHLAQLLNRVNRRLRLDAVPPAGFTELSVAQVRVLDVIPAGGCRIVDLSGELRVSSQGLGQLVKHLEREGYVELAAAPDDRRAKLIRRTGAGDAVVEQVSALLDGVEQAWRAEVGAERFDVFREVLGELAAKLP